MAKWESNGDHGSPNEDRLLGALVTMRQGNTMWVGKLDYVKAQTRGNVTVAVKGIRVSPRGRIVRTTQPIWELRRKPFTIEPATAEEAAIRVPKTKCADCPDRFVNQRSLWSHRGAAHPDSETRQVLDDQRTVPAGSEDRTSS